MSVLTTLLNLIKPAGADTVDIGQINASFDIIDAKYGGVRPVANAAARIALTPFQGQHVIEADTRLEYVYSGAVWVALSPSYYRAAQLGNAGVIGANSNAGVLSMGTTIVPTVSGRYIWRNTGWLRNTAAGSLAGTALDAFFGALQGTTIATGNAAPVGSMSFMQTGYVDLVAGTSYLVNVRFATGAGTGTWSMDAITTEITMAALIP